MKLLLPLHIAVVAEKLSILVDEGCLPRRWEAITLTRPFRQRPTQNLQSRHLREEAEANQHSDLGFLAFFPLFNIKSRVSKILLNNCEKPKKPKSLCCPVIGFPATP
jgi:hypothetical protein